METKLRRIAEIAKTKPKERFTSLVHLINAETLMQSHNNMKAGKASGIDNVTKYEYEADLLFVTYCSVICLLHIRAHPDSESGIIRTLFRHYPDSDLRAGYTLPGP